MSNVQDLLWCDARDEKGGFVHATDCDQHECFVVQGKKQETNTGGKAKMPDHYRCTITCAFCGKCKHYEECSHKQRLSAKLKSEAQSGGGSAGGKSHGEKGKGKSQGQGKGQSQAQGKGGGRGGRDKRYQDKNKDENKDRSGGNPDPTPGRTYREPSNGQQNTGPTTRFQTQAQQEHGTKRANEDGDEANAGKRSCFMQMAQKLRKKGFDMTSPGEF